MKIKKSSSKKLLTASIVIVALAVLAGMSAYFYANPKPDSANSGGKSASDPYNKVDYSPADNTDKTYNDAIKNSLEGSTGSNQGNSNESSNVKPSIVDANQYGNVIEVRAFIPNLVEAGGKCTITFTSLSGSSVTKEVAATADATTTRCQNLSVDRSAFDSAGTWSASVTYKSTSAQGTGDPKKFEIK